MSYIAPSLRASVILRAQQSCEYCLIYATYVTFVHEVDHVIAQKHGGATVLSNLIIREPRFGQYIFNLMAPSLSR